MKLVGAFFKSYPSILNTHVSWNFQYQSGKDLHEISSIYSQKSPKLPHPYLFVSFFFFLLFFSFQQAWQWHPTKLFLSLLRFERKQINVIIVLRKVILRCHISQKKKKIKREIQFSFSIFNLLTSTFPKVTNKIFSSTSGLLTHLDRQGLRHSDRRNTSDGTNMNCCRNTMRSFPIYLLSFFFFLLDLQFSDSEFCKKWIWVIRGDGFSNGSIWML